MVDYKLAVDFSKGEWLITNEQLTSVKGDGWVQMSKLTSGKGEWLITKEHLTSAKWDVQLQKSTWHQQRGMFDLITKEHLTSAKGDGWLQKSTWHQQRGMVDYKRTLDIGNGGVGHHYKWAVDLSKRWMDDYIITTNKLLNWILNHPSFTALIRRSLLWVPKGIYSLLQKRAI